MVTPPRQTAFWRLEAPKHTLSRNYERASNVHRLTLTLEDRLDGASDSTLWARLSKLFGRGEDDETLERAILEARADGEVAADEESMLLSILRIDDLQVQDVMTPRTDIDCVPSETSLAEAAKCIVDSGHSRIPVFHDTRDNIIGILHAKDLLRDLINPNEVHTVVDAIMREPFFVPETKGVRELLQEFRTRKLHIAIALDEYGGTSGLITIEDVLEEIVGDIEDEHDISKEKDIQIVSDNPEQPCYELTGRAYLEDLEELGISLTSDEVDTIGGYLSMQAGHVPTEGETFHIEGWTFTIKEADVKFIRRIFVERNATEHAEA